jgi:DNA (cytosine-5)-methyltransferase 1
MLSRQFILPLANEIIVDLFAGGGGASTGMEQAIGRHVDIAVNHDPEAVSLHAVNHPQTKHLLSNVLEVAPREVTEGRPVGLLWASPDCTFHSKARGGKPHRDRNRARRRRGLAWVVCRWAREVKPRIIALENVEEFQDWGPLGDDGLPCPQRRGLTFLRWVAQLRNLGYAVEWRELRGCDYGAPTIRKRLFVIARCDGQPIVWPQPTHGPGLRTYRTAAECIDWSLACPSIFERARPLADATLRRIAHGIKRFVLEAADPFIVRLGQTGHGDSGKVRSIDAPLTTITSKAEHCLVVPTLVQTGYGERPGQAPRVPGLDKPLGTVVSCGQKHALVTAFLAKHFGGEPQAGKTSADLRRPAPTVLARGGPQAVVTAYLAKLRGTSNSASMTEPLHTISAGGTHHAEVRALLLAHYGAEAKTAEDRERLGLVTIGGQEYVVGDIGMRMLQPRELYRAQGFPDSYQIDRGADGRPLSKAAQIRMCGNSVCPPLAEALVRANYVDQALRQAA